MTLNEQKAGSNSPSPPDIVSLLDLRTPDFLLFTETPPLPNNEALTHKLRNMVYKLYYHPINARTPPDTLPEARLPDHLTHPGGGCWIAYRKDMSLVAHVRPLRPPTDCPGANTCAVEATLRSGAKEAIIANYLP